MIEKPAIASKISNNTDSLFVCLTFSGGGTRAAALAYGVMEELNKTRIRVEGEDKSLLDEVDCISAVSGGSFTAAYYALFRERLFTDFRTRFLERNIQGALAARLLNPINLMRVTSPRFSRIDLAAELYDREVFAGATFARLEENGRPLVILNATNLAAGRRFNFTQEYFDAIGSNLDQYPVSRAVAASSAFPFLLSPISLKNYPLAEGYEPPWWYEKALASKDWTSRRYAAAKNLQFYLDKHNAYVHLMDGGLADNIGVRAILDARAHGFIDQKIQQGDIKRLVLIVVNARTQGEDRLSQQASPPGIISVAGKTATIAMDNYSFETIAQLRDDLYGRVQTQKDLAEYRRLPEKYDSGASKPPQFKQDIDTYVIEVNFEAAAFISGEDSRYYLDLPTTFSLSKEQVEKLIAIGPKLLKASPQYQCLLKVLKAEAEGRPRPPDCPVGAGIKGN
ncbi:MAG: patatin-like phospholipase family protein [Deltaproteobacteria bacterium]|nr:patatin-like phospholipase family protein [Deltaproteobacteria bacterium]